MKDLTQVRDSLQRQLELFQGREESVKELTESNKELTRELRTERELRTSEAAKRASERQLQVNVNLKDQQGRERQADVETIR